MKKFIQKILFFGSFCAIVMTSISVAIDPYNVFHIDNIRDNGVEPNTNYIKMKYILDNPTKYDAFLFGSSRVGSIHTENIEDVNCYNMTYSEGLPQEHLENLKTLIDNGIIPKRIYLGVDSLSYTMDPTAHYSEHSRISYEYARKNPLEFLALYIDPSMVLKSLEITNAHTPTPGYSERFYNYGWWCEYGMESSITKENALMIVGDYNYIDETIETIHEFVSTCSENNIECIVFTNPMHYITHFASRPNYSEFLQKLSTITDFYNFSGLNDITLSHDNYVDASHYNAETGDLMLEFIAGKVPNETLLEQGFGVYVTENNIQELLSIINSN